MTQLMMGDSSTPPARYPPWPIWAFYIGGDTPHVWTDAEIDAIPCRWVLPIFTRINPAADAMSDAREIIAWARAHGYRPGERFAADTETMIMPQYLSQLSAELEAAGFGLVDYESKGPLPENGVTSGGRWVADWTGAPHLYPGSVITQYASDRMLGADYDASVADAAVHLHEQNPPVTRRVQWTTIEATVPVLARGDSGAAVARLQALLNAWLLRARESVQIDGIFGPDTFDGLVAFQHAHGDAEGLGTVTQDTWEQLLTI